MGQVIHDEISTQNGEYAAALERVSRENGYVPHAGYMWRVNQIRRLDHSEVITYGGMFENGPPPGVYRIPGPTTFVVLLERDVPQNEG